jgi:hypothetical protein
MFQKEKYLEIKNWGSSSISFCEQNLHNISSVTFLKNYFYVSLFPLLNDVNLCKIYIVFALLQNC